MVRQPVLGYRLTSTQPPCDLHDGSTLFLAFDANGYLSNIHASASKQTRQK